METWDSLFNRLAEGEEVTVRFATAAQRDYCRQYLHKIKNRRQVLLSLLDLENHVLSMVKQPDGSYLIKFAEAKHKVTTGLPFQIVSAEDTNG